MNDPTILRSRDIRSTILRILVNVFRANPAISLSMRQIYAAFSPAVIPAEKSEVDTELAVMAEDGWIVPTDIPTMDVMAQRGFRLTRRGRDFYLAGCPWEEIDEYSGDDAMI